MPGQVDAGRRDADAVAGPGRQDLSGQRRCTCSTANLKAQLKAYLAADLAAGRDRRVLDDGDKSREMLELLHDIAVGVDLDLDRSCARDDAERKPSFALRRPGAEPQVRFAGVPMGHEFTSLVLALLQAGGHPPKVDDAVARTDPTVSTANSTSRPSCR